MFACTSSSNHTQKNKDFLALEELEVPSRSVCADADAVRVSMKGCSFRRDAAFEMQVDDLSFGRGLHMLVGPVGR